MTKENPPAVLSTHTYVTPDREDFVDARMRVANGSYTEDDLKCLMQYLNLVRHVTEVESVEITDANDITQEEANEIIEKYKKKYLSNIHIEGHEI